MNRLIAAVAVLIMTCSFSFASDMPQAGQQMRPIKAISAEDIEGYLSGKGMNMSKAAELNSYPGPKHVIEFAEEMGLAKEKLVAARELYEAMHNDAVALGAQLLEKESVLEMLFAQQAINEERLEALLAEIGDIKARLRFVHMNAHLRLRSVLDEEDVKIYNSLRGYDVAGNGRHAH